MNAGKRPTQSSAQPLFLVWSVAERFRGAADIVLSWFVAARPAGAASPPSARELFRDYDLQGAPRQRILDRYVEELFTAEEARLFADWLEGEMGMKARLVPVAPPMDPRVNPTGIVPATLNLGLYAPSRSSGPRPPVEAWAYYEAVRPAQAMPLAPPFAGLRGGEARAEDAGAL